MQVKADAGWRCEWCGAPHKRVIERDSLDPSGWKTIDWLYETDGRLVDTGTLTWKRLRFHGLTRVILTTAHLDRDSTNNTRENLAALCQRCHLRHDIRHDRCRQPPPRTDQGGKKTI